VLRRLFSHEGSIGGPFGPRENNIIQTAATASGGMSNVFVSALPALYQLNLLENPKADYWRIVSLTAVGGYFGFFFATPCVLYTTLLFFPQLSATVRKFFIIYLARELRLIFPTSSATALTIRSMHDAARGHAIGMMKMKALSISFGVAFVLRVVSTYCLGILWEWHVSRSWHVWN
jgi:uncharacterized oligopeptide transporter (OPT) family protein